MNIRQCKIGHRIGLERLKKLCCRASVRNKKHATYKHATKKHPIKEHALKKDVGIFVFKLICNHSFGLNERIFNAGNVQCWIALLMPDLLSIESPSMRSLSYLIQF